jgi:hypothetical protein
MSMLEGGSRSCAIILKDNHITKPLIPPQIDDPLTVSPEDILDSMEWQRGQGLMVQRGFDHHFMGPDSVHFIKDPLPFPV